MAVVKLGAKRRVRARMKIAARSRFFRAVIAEVFLEVLLMDVMVDLCKNHCEKEYVLGKPA